MKKHFLLLMLMALLPFVGWAQVKLGEAGVANYYYGDTSIPKPVVKDYQGAILTYNVYWTYDDANVYTTNDVKTAQAVTLDDLKTKPAGDTKYYVKVTGLDAYSGQHAWAEFTIQKATLAGAEVTLSVETYTYDGEAKEPEVAKVQHSTLGEVDADEYTVVYSDNTNAGAATVTITAKDAGNYQGEVTKNFTINKANIPSTEYTAPVNVSNLTYTGLEQNLITGGTITDSKYGTIQYKVGPGEYSTTIPTGLDAGNYTVSWKIVGGANYNDKAEANLDENIIGKCTTPLRIMPIAKTKPYDGEAFDIDDAQFTITGWAVGDDAAVQQTLKGLKGDATLGADADEYTVSVKGQTLTYKKGVDLETNYTVQKTFTATWKITKRPITITAKSQTVVFGNATPTINKETMLEIDGDPVNEDNIFELGDISLAYSGTYDKSGIQTDLAAGLTDVPMKTYEGAFQVTNKKKPANYDLTLVDGNLIISGGAYDVIVTVPNNIQYGSTIEPTCVGLDGEDPVTVTKAEGEEAIAYIYKDSEGNTLQSTPTTIGTYTVEVDVNTIAAEGNYAGGTATALPTPFNIVKKDLNLTLNSVALLNGDTKAILNSKKDDVIADYSDQLVGKETVELELDFNFEDATNVSLVEGVLKFENAYTKGNYITVAFAAGENNDNDNYNLVFTNGELIKSTDYVASLIGDGSAPAVIAAAAANGGEYDVNIKNRELVGGTWNVMVLPFAVNPLDFCNVIGQYAVFNRMKEVVDNKVYFKLVLDEIPANEPFLVKPVENVDLGKETTPGTPDYLFEDVTISVNNIEDGDVTYSSISGAKFIGTYNASMAVAANEAYALAVTGTNTGNWILRKSAWDLDFTKACIKLDSGASNARFFVEDIDSNGATAIKEISAETMKAIDNDGLYNLNGMKMQGVPTQKGIYIQNGKKVVIK